MNKILTTLVILLILSISPVNAVQIKETNPEHFLEEKYSNTSPILKHINKGAFTPILFIYLFKLIKILVKEVKKVTNKIKKTKEEIETDIEKTRKEINQEIEEIDTQSLIEVLGENHPVTQKAIYLKETKITNPLEFVKYSYTLLTFQKSLKKVIKERENLKTPKELEKTKTLLEKDVWFDYLYAYLLQKGIIWMAYALLLSAITLIGLFIYLLWNPALELWVILLVGGFAGWLTIPFLGGLKIYLSSNPEKREKLKEDRIEKIEEEIEKQRPHSNNTDIEESIQKEAKLKKLKKLKNTKKMLETRLKDHEKIESIETILPIVFTSCLLISVVLKFFGALMVGLGGVGGVAAALGAMFITLGVGLTAYSLTFLTASIYIYFSDPEKRKQAIEERTQEINTQIQELEHKIKETPTTSKIENNTTMILKNNTTITSIEGGL